MTKKNAVRPTSLDPLESRLVLSDVVARVPVQVAALSGAVPLSHPRPSPEAAQFEIRWMRGMIDHHGMAIRMARLALRNSADPEVLSLAHGIIRAQNLQIAQMQTWLSAGYGIRGVRPRMTPDDMQMLDELGALRGVEFDLSFLRQMIEHHEAAVEDADELLGRAFHARLRRLGTNIITTQAAEIQAMRAMLERMGDMAGDGGGAGGHQA
jgi:uncharacterized protein (DUF305 family)